MSVTAGLDVLINAGNRPVSEVFSSLLAGGWTASDYGEISYMESGEDFEWIENDMDALDDVLARVASGLRQMRPAGIVLTWPKPLTGGQFIMFPQTRTLSATWSIERRQLSSTRATDHSWYLERVIAPLEMAGFQIERIKCEDY